MAITQAKWASVLRLQKKQLDTIPMSYEELVYDKAVDLALGRLNEPESDYFSHNCYRNAKTHVARSSSNKLVITDAERLNEASVDTNYDDFVFLSEVCQFELSANGGIERLLANYFSGYSCNEISSITGQSVEAVKKARQRALQKLQRKFNS